MAQVKIFEVRDRSTSIPVVAVWLTPEDPRESELAARCGYGRLDTQGDYVLVAPLAGGVLHYDPFARTEASRTLHHAHVFIAAHFATMRPGDVVDVQRILGEI